MSAAAIEFSDVSLGFAGRVVLSQINLQVRQNEFIGVLGPNGAGKTTLMRAILGLLPPLAGSIRVLGAPATRGNPSIGYMPQVRSALPLARLSGWNFVAGAADGDRWGLPITGRRARAAIDRALELVDATALAPRPIGELSGGERQRLLLAQALLGEPQLLLLDEPLISLDPHHQRSVVALVRRIQQELRISVLFSAHELNPLLEVLDRVLYLGNGHVALGTVDEVITGPSLSRLYGSRIDVVRLDGQIFVMSGRLDVGRDEHQHHDDHDQGGPDRHGSSGSSARRRQRV
jgi:zinc/manganese transport system ATP-binding protein